MKRSLSTLLAVLLLASSFAGCSQSGGEAAPGSQAASPAEASASSQSAAESSKAVGEKTKLVFWDMSWNSDPYPEVAKKLVEEFNAQHDTIEIADYKSIAWDGYVQNFTTAIASGAGPDMATGGSSMQHLFAKMGEIVSLDPLIEKWTANGTISDFGPGVLENIRYNDEQIGIPWQFDPRMMWYNTEYFEQAGINEMPENQDEFYDVLVKLKELGVAPLVLNGKAHYEMMSFWQTLAWDHGGGMVLDREVIIDNEGNRNRFRF